MAKKLLIEETMRGSLGLTESVSQRKGFLGTMKGPCADFKNPTRNNNMYGRKLWENVFNDPIVKESLEDRILLGELDHPLDGRLETSAVNAAIVMTDYEFDDDQGFLIGSFDILDTPSGRILRSLLDYGCKIGVSSRGEGDVVTREGVDYVDEDSFMFVGFDAVVLPAVKAAKPTMQESLKHESLKESLTKEINTASTKSELDLIKKVVEATELPESGSLLESINNKSQELLEGTPCSSNLIEDLENATSKIKELEKENRSLKASLTTSKNKVNKLMSRLINLNSESKSQKKSFENLNNKYSRLTTKMTSRVKEIESLVETKSDLERQIKELNSKLKVSESLNKSNMFKLKKLNLDLSKSRDNNDRLKEHLSKSNDEVKALKESITKLESANKSLNEKLIKSTKANKELNEKLNSTLKSYLDIKAKSSGINPSGLLDESLGNSSVSKIDSVINTISDRNERYRSLPFTRDSLLESHQSCTMVQTNTETDEDTRSRLFMEQFYNLKNK